MGSIHDLKREAYSIKKMEWREYMRGFMKSLFILFSVIVIVAALIKYNQPSIERPIQKNPDANYNEVIGEKIQNTNFTKKIIVALRAAGYYPDSTIGYLIESPNNQVITIQLHNLDTLEKSTESEIQKIVNSIAETNDLQLFIVNVRLIDSLTTSKNGKRPLTSYRKFVCYN